MSSTAAAAAAGAGAGSGGGGLVCHRNNHHKLSILLLIIVILQEGKQNTAKPAWRRGERGENSFKSMPLKKVQYYAGGASSANRFVVNSLKVYYPIQVLDSIKLDLRTF